MIVAKPLNDQEPCLLKGNEYRDLYIYDLDENLIVRQNPPENGWNYESLESVAEEIVSNKEHPTEQGKENPLLFGWDAYLGEKPLDNWIGSSEV
jgi:hypothetical protein